MPLLSHSFAFHLVGVCWPRANEPLTEQLAILPVHARRDYLLTLIRGRSMGGILFQAVRILRECPISHDVWGEGHSCDRHKARTPSALLPRKPSPRFRIGTCVLFLVWLLSVTAWAQLSVPGTAPVSATPEVPKDALGRTTPKGTVFGFVTAARKGDDQLAERYLNTRLRGKAATDLAHQLFVVLDRRLPARLDQISDKPEGSLRDPLEPNRELVGTISGESKNIDIFVERVDRGKSGSVWLFSGKTLDSVPDLYEEINAVEVDHVLPEFLVDVQFAGIALFEWLAVFVGIPLFYLIAALLNRLLSSLLGLLRRRLRRKPDLPNPEVLPHPIRLLLAALVIHRLLTKLSLPLLARQFWSSTANIFTIAGCVWLLILLNDQGEEFFYRRLRLHKATGGASLLRLTRRLIDILIVFGGVLATLHYFGVSPTAALAGLGVGGIAVAFAAQKTLENVFGGVSLIFDEVVHVGDVLKVGDTLGTVDDIGLRSTRIRTQNRTMVSVPNGQIATMTLENFSCRDEFWLHQIFALCYGTASPQMCTVIEGIRSLLEGNQQVEHDSVRVRFIRFGLSSLDVEVSAYVLARDWDEFLEIQGRLFLRMMECIEAAGVQIALPSQTIFMGGAPQTTKDPVERLPKASPPTKDAIEEKAASA